MALAAEMSFEIDMTKEKLREMIQVIENAEKNAVTGQVLRIKLNHSHQFVVRNLIKTPVGQGVSKETDMTTVM